MIKEIIMFTVCCDNCGKDSNEGSEYSCWSGAEQAKYVTEDYGWTEVEVPHLAYEVINRFLDKPSEWIETTFSYYSTCHVANRRKTEVLIKKDYCPECVSYDDNDKLILKPKQ